MTDYRTQCAAKIDGKLRPVFPLLMAETWPHEPSHLCRSLYSGTKVPKVPLVALAHLIHQAPDESDTPGRAYLRTQRADQLGVTARDFEQEALFNIAQRPYSLQSFSPAPGVKFAIIEGDYLAAEHVLDPTALKRVHALLGETPIVVSVPARGQLYAAPLSYANSRPDDFMLFKRLVEATFAESGEIGISPCLFWVSEGRITSVLEVE